MWKHGMEASKIHLKTIIMKMMLLVVQKMKETDFTIL